MYFPPRMAAKLGIPLVFYGENPTEYGNAPGKTETASKDLSYFSTDEDRDEIYLAGVSYQDLINHFDVPAVDLEPYLPPQLNQIADNHVDVHYLGYYLQWHPQECYYFAVKHGGFQAAPERTAGTYSKYSSIDDKIDDLHYYTTFIKFGIGRATYDSSQEIRHGEIERDEGVALVRRYDGEYPERFESENFKYLSITENEFPQANKMFEHPMMTKHYFDLLTDKFRSPHIWALTDGQWTLRNTVFSTD